MSKILKAAVLIEFVNMPRTYKRDLKRKMYRKPDPENLSSAIKAIENKTSSIRGAAKKFNIHHSVVYRHFKSKGSLKKQGGQTALSPTEEDFIVQRLKTCADWGYPLDSFTLRMLIKEYLSASGKLVKKFKNNTPGKDFAYSFLKRHKKQLSERLCQNIKRSRAAVSREILTEYFERLENELKDVPPQNIINYDETNLRDDPGRKKVIVKRGCKYPERVMNSSKSSTSVMFSAAGDGAMLPVYVVYKAVHIYDSWTQNGPKFARYNRTKSGWFDSLCFEDWVLTVAVPYLKKQTGKKFLIGDNLSSHLSLESIRLCLEHDIHFIFLPANSTHLTQPLDVAFFAPLKRNWRQILEKWKFGAGRNMSSIPKDKFPRLLNNLLKRLAVNASNNVRSGFRKCGIVPVNKDQVLKMLPTEPTQTVQEEEKLIDDTFVNLLKSMRYEDTANVKPKKKSKLCVPPGKSIGLEDFDSSESSDASLFNNESDIVPEKIDSVCVTGEDDIHDSKINNMASSSYPFKTKPDDLKTGDWLAVSFFYSTTKAASSKQNKHTFIGKLVNISIADGLFEASFLRSSICKEFPGFIYRHPDVEDLSNFTFNQIVGKIRPPEKYKRGLLKFDLNVENC